MGRRKKEIATKKDIQEVSEIIEQAETKCKEAAKKKEVVEFVSSGCDLYDLALGGGYGWGKMVNIVGDNSTGKTLIAMECIAMAMKKYGKKLKWFYDDAEAGFSFDPVSMYGFEVIPEKQKQSFTIEDFAYNIEQQLNSLKKDEKLIYVLDSLDSLSSLAEIKREEKKKKLIEEGKDPNIGTYGLEKQKALSAFFRLMTSKIKEKNCLLIVISQVRTNINAMMFAKKHTRSGGKALDFYAAQIVWLSVIEKQKKKDRTIGVTIKAMNDKNKLGKPYRNCFINILFDYGVDNIKTNIDFLYDLKTDTGKQRTEKLEWDGEEYKPNDLILYIEKKNFEKELTKRVKEKWIELENSIAPKRKSK